MTTRERIISILEKFKVYNKENIFLKGEINAYTVVLKIVEDKLAILEREGFIPTAEDFGITEKEHYFDPINTSLSLADRRERLINILTSDEKDFTRAGIMRLLNYYPATFSIKENPFTQTLVIEVNNTQWVTDNIDLLKRSIGKFIPAHLNFQLNIV